MTKLSVLTKQLKYLSRGIEGIFRKVWSCEY